jgi:uncharacterized protein (DUF2062 family)
MPAMGPVIAFALAFPLRVNRASALLGSILFNTWVGVISLLLAIKIGSAVTGLNYHDVYDGWSALIKSFKWEKFFEVSVYSVLIPIVIGYIIISLFFATLATIVVYMIAMRMRNKKLNKG